MPMKGMGGNDQTMHDGQRKVGFAASVSVMVIPGRWDYSEEVRSSYWASKLEISQMTERNLIEFAADGWDWRNVTEEHQMHVLNGKHVHPVHSNPYLRDALARQIPYPRAVSPNEDEQMAAKTGHYSGCAPDRGAVTPDAEEMDRPSSPFVESVVLDDEMHADFDEVMLMSDPDRFLSERFSGPCRRQPRQDLPFGDSDDAYFTKVLYGTGDLRI